LSGIRHQRAALAEDRIDLLPAIGALDFKAQSPGRDRPLARRRGAGTVGLAKRFVT